jgi:hypothetical protein
MNKLVIFSIIIFSINASAQNFRQRAKDKSFNPQIGINATFLDQSSSRDTEEDGLSLSEVELQFTSDIDTNFAGTILLGIHKHHHEEEEDGDEHEEEEGYSIEAEEVFVETISIPNVTFKIGKSRQPFGKHNMLHHHAFPFINAPLVNEAVFGEEGLAEVGYGVSGLIPLPWFSELTVNYVQGENEDLFDGEKRSSKVVLSHFKNLWDINDATTFEFGLSGAKGENEEKNKETTLVGADLTFKWRPTQGGRYSSLEWGTEYIKKDKDGVENGELAGVVSYLKYQFSERMFAQYRYDYLGLDNLSDDHGTLRHTALFAYIPSEFSAFRVQYENIDDAMDEDEKRLSLQMVISIGAHPAHMY